MLRVRVRRKWTKSSARDSEIAYGEPDALPRDRTGLEAQYPIIAANDFHQCAHACIVEVSRETDSSIFADGFQ